MKSFRKEGNIMTGIDLSIPKNRTSMNYLKTNSKQ
jgi:hypothetical protein